MPSLTIKNIPVDLYERIKASASRHHRSINSEVIDCLDRVLFSRRIDPEAFLTRIDILHKRFSLSPLTDEVLSKAKDEGRP